MKIKNLINLILDLRVSNHLKINVLVVRKNYLRGVYVK